MVSNAVSLLNGTHGMTCVKTSLSVKDNEDERLVNNNGQMKREFGKVEMATSSVHDE